jgi:hypothetical protein
VKSIETLRLEDYLNKSETSHHKQITQNQHRQEQKRLEFERNHSLSRDHEFKEKHPHPLHTVDEDGDDHSVLATEAAVPASLLKPPSPTMDKFGELSEHEDHLERLASFHKESPEKINLLNHRSKMRSAKMSVSFEDSNTPRSSSLFNQPQTGQSQQQQQQQTVAKRKKSRYSEFELFLYSFTTPEHLKNIQNKINQIYEENYRAIFHTIDETNRLLKSPLKEFQKEVEEHRLLNDTEIRQSKDEEERKFDDDMKEFVVKEALSIKLEMRSLMSTKTIMDFLKNRCDLGKYLSHCSQDDIQSIANEATLVEIADTQVANTLQINQNESISYIYILIGQGELLAKKIIYADKHDEEDDEEEEEEDQEEEEEDHKKKRKPTETEEEREQRLQHRLDKFESTYLEKKNHRSPAYRKGSVYNVKQNRMIPVYGKEKNENEKAIIEKFNAGNILGENILEGGYMWEYTLLPPAPVANKEGKLKAMGKSRRTLLYTPKSQDEQDEEEKLNNLSMQQQINEVAQRTFVFCKINITTILRYVGRKDPEVEQFLTSFWKELKIYLDIAHYNDYILTQALQNAKNEKMNYEQYQLQKIKNQFYHNLTPINVIPSGRIRTYQAGMEIFQQGKLRNHMFIIKQGSATYFRLFPKDIIGTDIIPEKIETILDRNSTGTLLSGDFSFLDSEDVTLIDKIEESDLQFLDMISYSLHYQGEDDEDKDKDNKDNENEEKNGFQTRSSKHKRFYADDNNNNNNDLSDLEDDVFSLEEKRANKKNRKTQEQTKKQVIQQFYTNEKLFEYHQRKFHRFGHYKNTLVATSRCEVCVIEISEIAKSIPLLKKMIELSNEKYPQFLISNEEIIYNYYLNRFWSKDRLAYLKAIEREFSDKKLAQNYYQNPMNNVNDAYYNYHLPQNQKNKLRFQNKLFLTSPGDGNMTTIRDNNHDEFNYEDYEYYQNAENMEKQKSAKEKEKEKVEQEVKEKQRKAKLIQKEMIPFQYVNKFNSIISTLQGQEQIHNKELIQLEAQLEEDAKRKEGRLSPHKKKKGKESPTTTVGGPLLYSKTISKTISAEHSPRSQLSNFSSPSSPREEEEIRPETNQSNSQQQQQRPKNHLQSSPSPSRPSTAVPSKSNIQKSFRNRQLNSPSSVSTPTAARAPNLSVPVIDLNKEGNERAPSPVLSDSGSATKNRPPSPTTAVIPTTERRRNAVNIQLKNIHDIRIYSEGARSKVSTKHPSSSSSSRRPGTASNAAAALQKQFQNRGKSRDDGEEEDEGHLKLTIMDELLWQCHIDGEKERAGQHLHQQHHHHHHHPHPPHPHHTRASELLSKKKSPEDYVQVIIYSFTRNQFFLFVCIF